MSPHRRTHPLSILLAIGCLLVAAPPASAERAHAVAALPDAFFVELSSPPTADGTSPATIRSEQAAFRKAAQTAGVRFTERRSFAVLFNGLAVSIDANSAGALAEISGVKAVHPIRDVALPSTQGPELDTAVAMTGADVARSQLGLTGSGVKVGIVDTGIDYDHPDLGGCFGAGCRVVTGHDFVGDAYDSEDPAHDTPAPDAHPDDCNGHGTHVAGIAGANGVVDGVAPGVTFAAYRVLGCSGSTSEDILLAALERALADGVHVVNISIGRPYTWPSEPVPQAADRLVSKGIVVVGSAGNAGDTGIFSVGGNALGRKTIAAASLDNTHVVLDAFSVTPDDRAVGYLRADGAPAPPSSGAGQLARTGTVASTNDACAALPADGLAGRVALVRRGGCSFYAKAQHAAEAGATAVVIYNNVAGLAGATVAGTPAITIPVVTISAADGEELDRRLAGTDPVTLTWGRQLTVPHPTAGLVSDFSAYGLTPDLALKPDIGAPGGAIRSTVTVEQGSYDTLSGTSMAAPHVAGAAALVLQAKPKTPASAVRDILQNSADPAPAASATLGLDSVHRQGAGLVDIDDAILATTRVSPGKLELGESESGPATRTLTIANGAKTAVTYALSHVAAVATAGSTFTPSLLGGGGTAQFTAGGSPITAVTVPAGRSTTIQATVSPDPGLASGAVYGGYLVLGAQGARTYRIPYAGVKGDYQARVVLTPKFGYPWLARRVGPTQFENRPDGDTFTLQGDDIPYVFFNLGQQARRVTTTIADATTGESWHEAARVDHTIRSENSDVGFVHPITGITRNGRKTYTLPNGRYRATLSVLKALGDPANPAHTETWTSPVFTIARP